MKAQYTDATKYSVRLPDGTVVPRLFKYDWERLGIDKLEAEGLIEPYVEPEMPDVPSISAANTEE